MNRFALALVVPLLLLAACSAPAPRTPQPLALDIEVPSGGQWWVTTPEAALADYANAQIDLEFKNISTIDIEFEPDGASVTDDQRMQLWAGTGPTFESVAFTLTSFPTTTMRPGDTVTYSLSADTATLAKGGRFLAIRPESVTTGTAGPGVFQLVAGTATLTP